MSKQEKIHWIDSIVESLRVYCPQMMDDVLYWVACQFALESNFGCSRIAVQNHNLCGMSLPKSRISTNISSSGNFAKYRTEEDCIVDYCYWLAWNNFNYRDLFNLELFTRKLIAKKYCPETDYLDRVFNLYNSLK